MVRLVVAALILAEIAGFVLVGRWLGVLGTLLLVVLAGALGLLLLRRQGEEAMRALRSGLAPGRDPRPALRRGGFQLAAALLLIVPGFLGDIVALLLLLPPVQRALAHGVARRGLRVMEVRGFAARGSGPGGPATPRDRAIEEADWEEVAPPKRPTHRPSGWTRH